MADIFCIATHNFNFEDDDCKLAITEWVPIQMHLPMWDLLHQIDTIRGTYGNWYEDKRVKSCDVEQLLVERNKTEFVHYFKNRDWYLRILGTYKGEEIALSNEDAEIFIHKELKFNIGHPGWHIYNGYCHIMHDLRTQCLKGGNPHD